MPTLKYLIMVLVLLCSFIINGGAQIINKNLLPDEAEAWSLTDACARKNIMTIVIDNTDWEDKFDSTLTIPRCISKQKKLLTFVIDSRKRINFDVDFSNLEKLRTLFVAGYLVDKSINATIRKCKNLEYLTLYQIDTNFRIPAFIKHVNYNTIIEIKMIFRDSINNFNKLYNELKRSLMSFNQKIISFDSQPAGVLLDKVYEDLSLDQKLCYDVVYNYSKKIKRPVYFFGIYIDGSKPLTYGRSL